MSTFLAGKNNDLIVQGGQIRLESGLDAALQLSRHYAQTLAGEMIHAMPDGVRMFDTAFNRPGLALFANEIRRRIMQVPDVISVESFDARLTGDTLYYTAVVRTIYGSGSVSNFDAGLPDSPSVGKDSPACPDTCLFGFDVQDGNLVMYLQDGCTEPRMHIDDDGYLIVEGR
jgi:hypothetical protein